MLPERQYIDEISMYPEEQPKVHLEVYTNNQTKKKTKHRHLRKLLPKQKLVVFLAVIFAMCLVYVSLEAKITQIGYSVNQLQADIADAREVNDRLMLEVEELASPERIAQYAGTEDGMVSVDESNILYADIQVAETKAASDIATDGSSDAGKSEKQSQSGTENVSGDSAQADGNMTKTKKNTVIGVFSSLMGKLSAARTEAAEMAK